MRPPLSALRLLASSRRSPDAGSPRRALTRSPGGFTSAGETDPFRNCVTACGDQVSIPLSPPRAVCVGGRLRARSRYRLRPATPQPARFRPNTFRELPEFEAPPAPARRRGLRPPSPTPGRSLTVPREPVNSFGRISEVSRERRSSRSHPTCGSRRSTETQRARAATSPHTIPSALRRPRTPTRPPTATAFTAESAEHAETHRKTKLLRSPGGRTRPWKYHALAAAGSSRVSIPRPLCLCEVPRRAAR